MLPEECIARRAVFIMNMYQHTPRYMRGVSWSGYVFGRYLNHIRLKFSRANYRSGALPVKRVQEELIHLKRLCL